MSRSIPMQTPTGTPAVIAAPADGGDTLNTDASALLAEVAALSQRLAARCRRTLAKTRPGGKRSRERPVRPSPG